MVKSEMTDTEIRDECSRLYLYTSIEDVDRIRIKVNELIADRDAALAERNEANGERMAWANAANQYRVERDAALAEVRALQQDVMLLEHTLDDAMNLIKDVRKARDSSEKAG